MIKHCKNCGMPDTRPGIHFNEVGICQGCIYEKQKNEIDWYKRWCNLERLIDSYPSYTDYDCIIAVSGGKDSYFQTYTFKEGLGLKCLLVCIDDGFTHTKAGIHNLKNMAKVFDCDLFVYKLKPQIQKKIMRYTFENYNKPFWIFDQMIYTVPIWMAFKFNIPIVVYGENISVTRGLKGGKDTGYAGKQFYNTVVSDIRIEDVVKECGLSLEDVSLVKVPDLQGGAIYPLYTSYFVRWDAYENYQFAKSRGFKTLEREWCRWGGFMNYWQIDSFGYLMAFYSKWNNLGHSGFTDCVCELIRAGHITKEEGLRQIDIWEGFFDLNAMNDFCNILGYTKKEVCEINKDFYREENHD